MALIAPTNAALGVSLTPVFSWGAIAGATVYQIQIGRTADLAAPDLDTETAATSYNLAAVVGTVGYPLVFGLTYYWRIRAMVAGAWSAWVVPSSFQVESQDLPFIPVLDHVTQGQALLLEQFKKKPNMKAVTGFLLRQVQDFERAVYEVMVSRLLAYAHGAQLDMIGEWSGERRKSVDDEVYRAAIALRNFINNSSGNPEELTTIAQKISGATAVRYIEIGNGNYRLLFIGAAIPAGMLETMQRLSMAGTRLLGVHTSYPLRPFHMGDHMGQALLHE